MTSDVFRKLILDQERLLKLTNPLGDLGKLVNPVGGTLANLTAESEAVKAIRQQTAQQKILADIYGSSSFSRVFEDAEKHRKMLEGPLAEARRIGLLDPQSDLRKSIVAATQAQSLYENAFRLPAKSELANLIGQATEASSIAATLAEELKGTNALRTAMENMTRPWLHLEHATSSTNAFAELVSIGQNISRLRPFEPSLVDQLRPNLGDWRDPITFAEKSLINPLSRTELYLERGVDPNLTEFTVAAFHEGASIAGLETKENDEHTNAAKEAVDDGNEFARAEKAFAQLRRFEVAVRNFIVEVMEDSFGAHWMKRQLPKDMRDKWADKRQAEIDAGRDPRSLIEYADFSDYRMIIERGDNWKTAFKSVFRRPEDIRESFQRLNPVRIATMHSRIVTLDDELLLMVETTRVLKAIRTRSR